MLEFGKPKKAKCLEVRIGENVHAVPLAANLPLPFAKKINAVSALKPEEQDEVATEIYLEYFGAYLGSDIDSLDIEDFGELVKAWNSMSAEGGASLGESQASSE